LSAAFSADGTRVVTASADDMARVWDARTGQPVGTPLRHQGQVNSAVFSADGTRVVTASTDRTARVWDARTGQPVGPPLQHQDHVTSAAFSADGMRVVTASWDQTARVWDSVPGNASEPSLIAEAAEALAGYRVNDSAALVQVESQQTLVMRLRQEVETTRFGGPGALSVIKWLLEDPWTRTISPLSAISVEAYLTERLKRCTPQARFEAESHFLGHPLLLKVKEFCPDAITSDTDKSALSPSKSTP
jgi:hypothetical protein